MKEFVEYLVKELVNNQEAVAVEEETTDMGTNIRIKVASEDMGIVIGKEGKNIRSIRSLAKAKAIKDDIRINIELEEPNNEV